MFQFVFHLLSCLCQIPVIRPWLCVLFFQLFIQISSFLESSLPPAEPSSSLCLLYVRCSNSGCLQHLLLDMLQYAHMSLLLDWTQLSRCVLSVLSREGKYDIPWSAGNTFVCCWSTCRSLSCYPSPPSPVSNSGVFWLSWLHPSDSGSVFLLYLFIKFLLTVYPMQ